MKEMMSVTDKHKVCPAKYVKLQMWALCIAVLFCFLKIIIYNQVYFVSKSV